MVDTPSFSGLSHKSHGWVRNRYRPSRYGHLAQQRENRVGDGRCATRVEHATRAAFNLNHCFLKREVSCGATTSVNRVLLARLIAAWFFCATVSNTTVEARCTGGLTTPSVHFLLRPAVTRRVFYLLTSAVLV